MGLWTLNVFISGGSRGDKLEFFTANFCVQIPSSALFKSFTKMLKLDG